jgi:hypothetical protein
MIYKDWYDGDSRFWAAEIKGLTELLRGNFTPGIISDSAALAVVTASGAPLHEIHVADFTVAGDALVTGGAWCTEFYITSLDFLTSGPAGTALPSGTYKCYLRVQEVGAGARTMKCWPCVTTEAETFDVDSDEDTEAKFIGTIDETRYLVVRQGIVWNATTSTIEDLGVDMRSNKYGCLDLAALGRGIIGSILIGGRSVYITSLVAAGLTIDANGTVDIGAGAEMTIGDDLILGIGNDAAVTIGTGLVLGIGTGLDMDVAKGGSIVFADGTGAGDPSVEITIGDYGLVMFAPNSTLDLFGLANLEVGAMLQKTVGSSILMYDQVMTDTPGKNDFYGAQLARVHVYVNADGTYEAGAFNVASVVRDDDGKYTITFKRAFTNNAYSPSVTIDGGGGTWSALLAKAAGNIQVWTYPGAVPSDAKFTLVIHGGALAA